MSEIIWPLCKTRLRTWWQNPCWQSQRSDVSCSWFAHISGGTLSHSSLQILSKSLRFWGWLWLLEPSAPSTDFLWDSSLETGKATSSWGTLLLPWPCVLDHCHAGIPIHNPLSMPWLASMPWPWRYMALSIVLLLRPCSSWLIPHRSHWNSTRWDLASNPSYFVFLQFANNRTNCCHLLTKLLGDGLL